MSNQNVNLEKCKMCTAQKPCTEICRDHVEPFTAKSFDELPIYTRETVEVGSPGKKYIIYIGNFV